MREKKIILSFYEETPDGVEPSSLGCECFAEPHEAKAFIERNMRAEAEDLMEKAILENGDPTRMWIPGNGQLRYKIGDHSYVYAWRHIPGDGNVTDDELVSVLESYVNSNRSHKEYETVARRMVTEMHRYCQNELWKLVKHIIGAIAAGGWDDRNRTARSQAEEIQTFMEEKNL